MILLILLLALSLHLLLHYFSWTYRTRVCRRVSAWWLYWTRDTPEQRRDQDFQRSKQHGQLVLTAIACLFLGAAFCATLIHYTPTIINHP